MTTDVSYEVTEVVGRCRETGAILIVAMNRLDGGVAWRWQVILPPDYRLIGNGTASTMVLAKKAARRGLEDHLVAPVRLVRSIEEKKS